MSAEVVDYDLMSFRLTFIGVVDGKVVNYPLSRREWPGDV